MIAHLHGKLVASEPTCVIDVGGVGFELHVPDKDRRALAASLGDMISLHTYLYVREDRLTLFGFLTHEDRELFTRLIDVSGIGPKIAVNILGEYPTERIVEAVQNQDHTFLTKLPGLGKKTAERLTVELKDKLDYLRQKAPSAAASARVGVREEALLALTNLGMPRQAAEKALDKVDWQSDDAASLPDIVKEALKHAGSV